jgi:CrcB protein
LVANLIGVALATLIFVFFERKEITDLRNLLLPGFCAGLTTFSAVMVQSIEPETGTIFFLAANIFLSLLIVITLMPILRKYILILK